MVCERFDVFGHPSNVREIAFEYFYAKLSLFAFAVQLAGRRLGPRPKNGQVGYGSDDKCHTPLEYFLLRLGRAREVLRSGWRLDLSGYRDWSQAAWTNLIQ